MKLNLISSNDSLPTNVESNVAVINTKQSMKVLPSIDKRYVKSNIIWLFFAVVFLVFVLIFDLISTKLIMFRPTNIDIRFDGPKVIMELDANSQLSTYFTSISVSIVYYIFICVFT